MSGAESSNAGLAGLSGAESRRGSRIFLPGVRVPGAEKRKISTDKTRTG